MAALDEAHARRRRPSSVRCTTRREGSASICAVAAARESRRRRRRARRDAQSVELVDVRQVERRVRRRCCPSSALHRRAARPACARWRCATRWRAFSPSAMPHLLELDLGGSGIGDDGAWRTLARGAAPRAARAHRLQAHRCRRAAALRAALWRCDAQALGAGRQPLLGAGSRRRRRCCGSASVRCGS
jgi:hypothetical protein